MNIRKRIFQASALQKINCPYFLYWQLSSTKLNASKYASIGSDYIMLLKHNIIIVGASITNLFKKKWNSFGIEELFFRSKNLKVFFWFINWELT